MSENVLNFTFDRSKWTTSDVESLTPNAKASLLIFVENSKETVSLTENEWAKLVGITVDEMNDSVRELVDKEFLIEYKVNENQDTKKGLTSRADKLG